MKREGIKSNRVGKNVLIYRSASPRVEGDRETPRELWAEVNTTTGRLRMDLWTHSTQSEWSPHALGEAVGPAGSPWWLSSWEDVLLRGVLVVVGGLLHDDWTQTQHLQVLICAVWQTLTHDLEQRGNTSWGKCSWHNVATRRSALLKPNNQLLHWSLCPGVLFIWSCIKRHLSNTETLTPKLCRWKLHSVSASTIITHWFVYPLPSNSIFSVSQQVIDESAQAGKTGFKSLGVRHI